MKTEGIVIEETGGPNVLQWRDIDLADPGPGEVLMRHEAIGLNYIDTYMRTGMIPLTPPFTPGLEAAGVVEALGDGVEGIRTGDRVAYSTASPGGYARHRIVDAEKLIALPDEVDFETAAAVMLKGMTVEYLIRRTYAVQPEDIVLFHAAAGGVGTLACQWLKLLGATVIGTVGSKAKAEIVKAHGCDYPILYSDEDVAARVREITDGRGVPVVYDGVGAATLEASLDSLAPRGVLACFGAASGAPRAVTAADLQSRGSLYFTRPSLAHYCAERDDLLGSAAALFEVLGNGVNVEINQHFRLAEAAEAHRALEARETIGATVLLP